MPDTNHPMTEVLFRNEQIAIREAHNGYHHALYLMAVLKKLLFIRFNIEFYGYESDATITGSHRTLFRDPVTKVEYELRITPRNQGAKNA